jgi:hypothetical protein
MREWEGYQPSVGPERVEEFRGQVRQRLEPLAAELTAVLKRLIERRYPEGFWLLGFEVDQQGLADGFPVLVYFYEEGFDQVMEGDRKWEQYPSDVPQSLLHSDGLFPDSMLEPFRGVDDYWPEQEAIRLLIEWFHRCWTAAGGKTFRYRATIEEHDRGKPLDLVSGEWIDDL